MRGQRRDSEEAKEEEEAVGGPVFEPRLYKQRYHKVAELLQEWEPGPCELLMDLGTAEGQFIRSASSDPDHRLNNVGHFVGVDLDVELMRERGASNLSAANGRFEDFCLLRRHRQLRTSLYAGDVTHFDPRFADVRLLTAIELVEHLPAESLWPFAESVFGRYRPSLAVLTTPNREFNVLFPQLKDGEWRHWDHKFEWTRFEFRDWCLEVCSRYPAYELVALDGVGWDEERVAEIGPCSQIAVFRLKESERAAVAASKAASLRPLVAPTQRNVMRLSEDGELEPDSSFQGPPEEDDPDQGLYKAVYHMAWPWSRLAPVRQAVLGALRSALSELSLRYEAQSRGQRDRVGRREGFYVPVQEVVEEPGLGVLGADAAELTSFLLARAGFANAFEDPEEFIFSNDASCLFITTGMEWEGESEEEEDPWHSVRTPTPPPADVPDALPSPPLTPASLTTSLADALPFAVDTGRGGFGHH